MVRKTNDSLDGWEVAAKFKIDGVDYEVLRWEDDPDIRVVRRADTQQELCDWFGMHEDE